MRGHHTQLQKLKVTCASGNRQTLQGSSEMPHFMLPRVQEDTSLCSFSALFLSVHFTITLKVSFAYDFPVLSKRKKSKFF